MAPHLEKGLQYFLLLLHLQKAYIKCFKCK